MEFLGRTKIRTKDAIVTVRMQSTGRSSSQQRVLPRKTAQRSEKQLNLMRVAPLDDEQAKQYRSGRVGNLLVGLPPRSNSAGHHPNAAGSSGNLLARCGAKRSISHRQRSYLCAGAAGEGQTVPQLCRRASAWGLAQSFDTLRCEFYVWDAIQAKLLSLAKVKGTVN